jgi:hypothetical protein
MFERCPTYLFERRIILKVTSQLSRGFCGLAATFWVCLVADKSGGFVRLHEYK